MTRKRAIKLMMGIQKKDRNTATMLIVSAAGYVKSYYYAAAWFGLVEPKNKY